MPTAIQAADVLMFFPGFGTAIHGAEHRHAIKRIMHRTRTTLSAKILRRCWIGRATVRA